LVSWKPASRQTYTGAVGAVRVMMFARVIDSTSAGPDVG
jgi:hypothetical protein